MHRSGTSSKMTRSQLVVWTHSFFALMRPVFRSRPSRSWNEPKRPAVSSCRHRLGCPGGRGEVLPAVEVGVRLKSACQASSTAGLKVTTRDASRTAGDAARVAAGVKHDVFGVGGEPERAEAIVGVEAGG